MVSDVIEIFADNFMAYALFEMLPSGCNLCFVRPPHIMSEHHQEVVTLFPNKLTKISHVAKTYFHI